MITKSTVPGVLAMTSNALIAETNPKADVAVDPTGVPAPGRGDPGLQAPDRIVVGTEDDRARKVISEIYRPLYLNQAPIMYTGRRTAELIKYAANAFLATKITFINEIARSRRAHRR